MPIRHTRPPKEGNSSRITEDQKSLMDRMQALGYRLDKGECYGITSMVIQAYLVGELDKFITRLHALDSMVLDDDFRLRLETQFAHEREAFKNGMPEDTDKKQSRDRIP